MTAFRLLASVQDHILPMGSELPLFTDGIHSPPNKSTWEQDVHSIEPPILSDHLRFVFMTVLPWSLLLMLALVAAQNGSCPEAMFWFGDSIVDTGNLEAATPGATTEPLGMTYFGKPSSRESDGRVSTDFFAQALRFDSFIDPILKSVDVNYKNGVNFAVSGATALNTTYFVPMYLPTQVDSFINFKQSAYSSKSQARSCLEVPDNSKLANALYAICIGANDIVGALTFKNKTPREVATNIVPAVVTAISHAIQVLYGAGAKNFLIYNVFPYGCLPSVLTYYRNASMGKDFRGCLVEINQVSELHNKLLFAEIEKLRDKLSGSQILYADAFNFTLNVLDNPANYGFNNETKLRACCGIGEPYNFNSSKACGLAFHPSKASLHPSQFLSWDGLHFTEAYYRQLTEALLTGRYIDPPSNFFKSCDLDFSKFVKKYV